MSDLSPESLRAAVRLSEQLMELAPPDPEWVEGLRAQKYPTIDGFHAPTASASPAQRLRGVKAALELARAEKLEGSGFFESEARYSAIANKKGNFALSPQHHRRLLDHHADPRRHRVGLGGRRRAPG